MERRRRGRWGRARGGAGAAWEILGALGMWAVMLTGLIALWQAGATWTAAERAARAAALGVATYGCWTPAVTGAVQAALANAPGHGAGATAALAVNGVDASSQPVLDVAATADPSMQVTVSVPLSVRWFGVGIWSGSVMAVASTTSSAYHAAPAEGGGGCTAPQA
ncbi:MAG: hypothetical protein K6U87_14125 [Firmicutes bacterium]|nr:hypothetical protein [Bacillota bacterium]